MWKNEAGAWEHDFRVEGMPRYHVTYGTVKKGEAERLHAAVSAVYRARLRDVAFACKARRVTPEQLAELIAAGKPLGDSLIVANVVEPWPAIGEAVEMYVQALDENENKADGTTRAAQTQLTRFLAFQDPETPLDAIMTADLREYQSALVAEGYAVNTITAAVWRVGSLYRWFIRREAIDAREHKRPPRVLHVPLDPETTSTARTKRARFLSAPEAVRLLAATPPSLMFPVAAGLFGGFRVDEMIHLRTGFDVDLELGTLAVQEQPGWKPKTKRSRRHVPIAGALRPILDAHLAARSSEEWVTPSFRNPSKPLNRFTFEAHFARIVEDAELIPGRKDPEGVTYHCLRHSFASWLLMRGVDLYTTAQLLGNTVKQVEDTYGHLAKDHRQRAVDRLSDALETDENAPPDATNVED